MQRFLDFEDWFLSMVTGRHEWLASHFTGLFHSPLLYAVILIVMLLTLGANFNLDQRKRTGISEKLTSCMTIAFPLAMLLMQLALLTLGREGSVWWCDPYQLGGKKAMLHIVLLLLFLAVQWITAIFFVLCRRQGVVDDGEDEWKNMSFWTLFVSLVVFYPFGSWVIGHLLGWLHLPGIVGIVLWCFIPVVGILNTWMDNHEAFGPRRGLLYTLLVVCVAMGLLVGICCLIEALGLMYHYSMAQFWLLVILAVIIFALMGYGEAEGGVLRNGTKIIYVWFENPGCFGFIIALVLGYLAGHFWFHWF